VDKSILPYLLVNALCVTTAAAAGGPSTTECNGLANIMYGGCSNDIAGTCASFFSAHQLRASVCRTSAQISRCVCTSKAYLLANLPVCNTVCGVVSWRAAARRQSDLKSAFAAISRSQFALKCDLWWMSWAELIDPVILMFVILAIGLVLLLGACWSAVEKSRRGDTTVTHVHIEMTENPAARPGERLRGEGRTMFLNTQVRAVERAQCVKMHLYRLKRAVMVSTLVNANAHGWFAVLFGAIFLPEQ
jgi:hypothetical protein